MATCYDLDSCSNQLQHSFCSLCLNMLVTPPPRFQALATLTMSLARPNAWCRALTCQLLPISLACEDLRVVATESSRNR